MLDPLYRPGPGAPELVLTRDYKQAPQKLWAAISTPERIAAWMDVEWRGDAELKLGARFAYVFRNAGLLTEGVVTAFEPGKLLAHTWFENNPGGEAEVRWAVAPHEGGSRLTLTHVYTGAIDDAARTGVGWSEIMDALARGLGEEPDPEDALGWRTLHRRLMGALPPAALRDGRVARRADGGWTLTFDRRIAHPVAKVWTAISTAEGVGAWMIADAIVEPKVGGRYRLDFHGFEHVMDGEITTFEPERRIAYTWPERMAGERSQVAIDLAPDGENGTRLFLTHDLSDATDIFSYAGGWHWHLDQVDGLLGGGTPVRQPARDEALRTVYRMILFFDLPGGAPAEAGSKVA